MSNFWYPVIDYEKCSGCLACVNFCAHEVYEIEDGKPKVVKPENCVSFCKGCLKGACPTGAISFIFDEEKYNSGRGVAR